MVSRSIYHVQCDHVNKMSLYLKELNRSACLFWLKIVLTHYDPGGVGAFKALTLKFCHHAFNSRATFLCIGDFSQTIVFHRVAKIFFF